ncbi:phosphoribosyl-AMP cyclohydrolase [Agaribacterium haliotis]|uniref:phosphoribosyl-AMP cyclohydrolase n=1 Tax=Agaribacterium haliotis TaxID=2013869 RepID=UPI000BB583D4|nr:phosphoribosyl-AMP cyclohydrolase [Agaribacterium haliotis]
MKRPYFEQLEKLSDNSLIELDELLANIAFNDQGLLPVICQDANTSEVLMFAWMNREALSQTIKLKRMVYWSRSRQQLWQKGESSGHIQELVSMQLDCDGDTLLCKVKQRGAACHTGRKHCFYLHIEADQQRARIQSS